MATWARKIISIDKPSRRLGFNGFVKIETEPIGSDDEEDLKRSSVPLVDPPIADRHTARFQFFTDRCDTPNQNCGTILRRILTVHRETDLDSIPFQDHAWNRVIPAFNFQHSKMRPIPLGCVIEIMNG